MDKCREEFESCPVCQEQSDQCLTCASYVVEGERIYYEKLKDYGATQDHELRFIQRIQKHRTTAFFHKGKLHIPSRQGRSVPLAIGLQWEAWQEQQAKVEKLQALFDQHDQWLGARNKNVQELFDINVKHAAEKAELQKRIDDSIFILSTIDNPNEAYKAIDLLLRALRGEQALKGEG